MVYTDYGNEEEQNLEDLLSEISEPDEETNTKVKDYKLVVFMTALLLKYI